MMLNSNQMTITNSSQQINSTRHKSRLRNENDIISRKVSTDCLDKEKNLLISYDFQKFKKENLDDEDDDNDLLMLEKEVEINNDLCEIKMNSMDYSLSEASDPGKVPEENDIKLLMLKKAITGYDDRSNKISRISHGKNIKMNLNTDDINELFWW